MSAYTHAAARLIGGRGGSPVANVLISPNTEERQSRVAEVPRPDGPWRTNRSGSVLSYEPFLSGAIARVSLEELVT